MKFVPPPLNRPNSSPNLSEKREKAFRCANAWEQRKIKDLVANTYGGGTPSTSNPDFWEGSIPWIQSSDLSEHNLFRVRPRKFISQAAVTNSPVKIIPESSIAVITRVGVGKLAVMNFSYTTSQDFLSLSNLNTDVKFTSYQLYRRLQKDLNAVQGTSIKGITKEELLGKNIFIPGRQEQEAIGKFFSKIDSLLTLHQRKWVEFFYPTYFRKFSFLNFWEFFNNRITNAWEQRKLSDGMTEYTDRVFIEDDQIYKQVTVKNTGEISLRGSQPGRNIGRKRQARVNLRDYPMTLIFTRQTVEQGGIGFAKNDVDGCIVTENMPTIAVDGKKFNQDFLVAFFKTYGFRKDVILSNIEGGTAQIAIHEDDILDSSSTFPSLKEQIKIGNFFRTLSQQITLHQRQSVSSDLLGASLHL